MNLPLNIDLQQVLLHLLNFVILAGGLYFLLYKPVRKFMEQRIAHFAELEEAAAKKQADAEQLRSDYDRKLAEAQQEISRMQSEAEKRAQEAAQERLQTAQQQADALLRESRKTAEAEKQAIVDSAKDELVQLAVDAARKIVMEPDEAFDSFAAAVRSGDGV